jgi:hypothetical protein
MIHPDSTGRNMYHYPIDYKGCQESNYSNYFYMNYLAPNIPFAFQPGERGRIKYPASKK